MEMLQEPLKATLAENIHRLRESERREPSLYQPDPSLSRQQRRLAERMAAKGQIEPAR